MEKLRESEEIYRTLVESSNDGIVILQDGKIVFANKKVFETLNYKKEQVLNEHFIKFLQPQYRELVSERYFERLEGKKTPQTYEIEIVTKKSKILTCEVTSSRIIYNSKPAIASCIRIIEERKKILGDIRKSEAVFENILTSLSDLVFVLDKEGKFTLCHSPISYKLYKSPEEFLGEKYSKVMPPHINKLIDRAIEKNKKMELDEFEYSLNIDDEIRWYSAKLSPMLLDGEYTGSVAIVRDITERKRAEERFKNIFENVNDCMIYLDITGRIIDINRKAVEVFGGSKEELLGKNFTRIGIFSPADIPKLMSNFVKILSGKKSTIEVFIKNKKRREFFLECSHSLMKVDDKPIAILVVARDITERKEAEEELKKTRDDLIKKVKKALDAHN
jgi:PAS domain S-box-containing protein